MTKEQLELAKLIERYFGADAGYLDIDCFTLAKKIIEAGWTKENISYVEKIKETKRAISQILDSIMETDKKLAYYDGDNPYYRGKLAAMEILSKLVDTALTNLCTED